MNIVALLCTIGCCLVSLIIAGISGSNKDDKKWFESLKHPDNSFLLKIMNKLGFIMYLLFGFILYQLFVSGDVVSIIITIIIIQLTGLSPLLLNKTKNLKLFFNVMLIFTIPVPILIFFLLKTKSTLAILIIIYLLWEVYDLSYFYRLMKLNKNIKYSKE